MLIQLLIKQGAVGNNGVFGDYVEYVGMHFNFLDKNDGLWPKNWETYMNVVMKETNELKDNSAVLAFSLWGDHVHVFAYADSQPWMKLMGKILVLWLFLEACEISCRLLK